MTSFLLERWSAIRTFRRSRRPLSAATLALAAIGMAALAASGPGAGQGPGVGRGYGLLAWGEFLLLLIATLVESGASIAEERRHGTWDAIRLTALSAGELARGKLLGSLATPALIILLAIPAHLAYGLRNPDSWAIVACLQAILAGTALAAAGFGVVASAWSDRALQGVVLAAAGVLFPWFSALDWLAGGGVAPAICRLLHPARHLEWLLAAGLSEPSSSIAARGSAYLLFGATIAAFAWLIATGRLRKMGDPAPASAGPSGRSGRRRARAVRGDPVFWRERHDPGGRKIEILVGSIAAISTLAILSAPPGLSSRGAARGLPERANGLLIASMLASGVVVGLRAAVTLADERKRRTLEPLFLADIEPIDLIRSKLAAIARPLRLVIPLVAACAAAGYGDRVGYLNPAAWLGAAAAAAIVLSTCFLIAALSVACSAWMGSVRTALIAGAGILVAINLGTILVGIGLAPFLPDRAGRIAATASPLMQFSIVQHAVTGHHSLLGVRMLLGVLAGEFAIGLVALAAATWRLERESRPSRPRSEAAIIGAG
jgi:ABC-type Na+ efflux pump permease subunit